MKGENIKYLLLILSILMVAFTSTMIFAQSPTLVYIEPAINSHHPGESFTVEIRIQDVVDLYSYEVKMGYNPNFLDVFAIEEGPFIRDNTTSPYVPPTVFQPVINKFEHWLYAACATLGNYPGITGSGLLFSVTFNVTDPGACDLDLYDSILMNHTPDFISHDLADGYFSTPERADLLRRSAWPEHHHFDVSKDEDSNSTHANQTLNAKVKNLGPTDILIMVEFDIMRDDAFLVTVSSSPTLVTPGTIVNLDADFLVGSADQGKYYVSARAYCSWSEDYWHPGEKVKTFSFAVVP